MSAHEAILAVDIGTSGAKGVLFDPQADPIAVVKESYSLLSPRPEWIEQDPEAVLEAVLSSMQEAMGSLPQGWILSGVCFSSQLYSILAVDAQGNALSNSLPWTDRRSSRIARAIARSPEAEELHKRTGQPIDAMFPLSKIRWLKEEGELPERVRFVSIKEFIIHRLTGHFMVDWSLASATGLFDVEALTWYEPALMMLGITSQNLSDLASPREILRAWRPEVVDSLGIHPETPLILGSGDGPLASLGVGATHPRLLAVNVGTSAAARVLTHFPLIDPNGGLYTQVADQDLWVTGGVLRGGGIIHDWGLETLLLGPDRPESGTRRQVAREAAEGLASGIPPGSEGLLFLPYLTGEGSPDWNPRTRGAFFGLSLNHGKGHLLRAVLEGITRSIERAVDRLRAIGAQEFTEVRVTGGLTASDTWLQIAADMLGIPVRVPMSPEGSARGAALLGLTALGRITDLEKVAQRLTFRKVVEPRPAIHARYEEQGAVFEDLLECSRRIHQPEETSQ